MGCSIRLEEKRNDPIGKTIPSKFFNFIVSWFSGIKIHDFNCGLKAYNKNVIKSLNIYGGLHRFIPYLASSNGFSVTEIPVNHRSREFGTQNMEVLECLKVFLIFKCAFYY